MNSSLMKYISICAMERVFFSWNRRISLALLVLQTFVTYVKALRNLLRTLSMRSKWQSYSSMYSKGSLCSTCSILASSLEVEGFLTLPLLVLLTEAFFPVLAFLTQACCCFFVILSDSRPLGKQGLTAATRLDLRLVRASNSCLLRKSAGL